MLGQAGVSQIMGLSNNVSVGLIDRTSGGCNTHRVQNITTWRTREKLYKKVLWHLMRMCIYGSRLWW